jgi:hypothetical protein
MRFPFQTVVYVAAKWIGYVWTVLINILNINGLTLHYYSWLDVKARPGMHRNNYTELGSLAMHAVQEPRRLTLHFVVIACIL